MDAELVKVVGATVALSGVAIGSLVRAFRSSLHKGVLSSMSETRAYSVLRVISIGWLVVAVVGIVAWSTASFRPELFSFVSADVLRSTAEISRSIAVGRQPGGDTPGDTGFDVANPKKKN